MTSHVVNGHVSVSIHCTHLFNVSIESFLNHRKAFLPLNDSSPFSILLELAVVFIIFASYNKTVND